MRGLPLKWALPLGVTLILALIVASSVLLDQRQTQQQLV